MTTSKGKTMIYLSDEDWEKLEFIMKSMFSDTYTETFRRLVREKYRELKEIENKKSEGEPTIQ